MLPSSSASGSDPFQVSSSSDPSDPRSAPEIVPVANRSPVRIEAPFDVAWASCCGIVQYRCRAFVRDTTLPWSTTSSSMSSAQSPAARR